MFRHRKFAQQTFVNKQRLCLALRKDLLLMAANSSQSLLILWTDNFTIQLTSLTSEHPDLTVSNGN